MKPGFKSFAIFIFGLSLLGVRSVLGQVQLPPSLPDENPSAPTEAVTATATPAPTFAVDPKKRAQDEDNLRSLEGTYEYELKLMVGEKAAIEYELADTETREFELWKRVKAFTQAPSVSIHGLGRAFGISQQYYGTYSNYQFTFPSDRFERLYLDFQPIGVVSKEVRMDGVFRWYSSTLPVIGPSGAGYENINTLGTDNLTIRHLRIMLSPDFLTAVIGDFDEAYTPFTLWNRNNLDLAYKPEMIERVDDFAKYESSYNHEPAWPFRGLKMETALAWPDSNLVDIAKVSTFAHMIRNGAVTAIYDPGNVADWIFAGHGEVKSKKWYSGFTSWQAFLDVYGVILDEPADSNPKYKYSGAITTVGSEPNWLHQYRIWSVRPLLKVGLGDDTYVGGQLETAFSEFQDDKFSSHPSVADSALRGGPFFQMGNSKISINYLSVGPNYFSPLAQTRQDLMNPITLTSPVPIGTREGVPDLFQEPLRAYALSVATTVTATPGSIFFLQNVPRASQIFGFYDRTEDNTFPYGLGTPNRQGVGMEMDIRALKNYAFKLRGSVYFVNETSGNMVDGPVTVISTVGGSSVTNVFASAPVTAVDSEGQTIAGQQGPILKRNFTYVNFGPSFDFGPLLGLSTPVELGVNVRYEQTTSLLGNLNSTWFLSGLRIGFFSGWEATVAYSEQDFSGTEEGYNISPGTVGSLTTPLARYSYVNDGEDLGFYRPFTIDGSIQSLILSTNFTVTRGSHLYLDYVLTQGTQLPTVGPIIGTMYNQYIGGTYQIEF